MDMDTIRALKPRSFDIVDISAVPKYVWQESFAKADILAFGGGNVSYLLEWLEKSGVKEALPELLKTRVYIGLSAGSMVTAKTISLSRVSLQYYEKTGKLEIAKGLGFVDFEIRPHLNSPDFPKVRLNSLEKIARETPATFYAIDDASAIKVDGDNISVISEGKWKKFN
jgi:dipeptidase E